MKKRSPLFTVFMPIYNVEQYVVEAVKSVPGHTIKDLKSFKEERELRKVWLTELTDFFEKTRH